MAAITASQIVEVVKTIADVRFDGDKVFIVARDLEQFKKQVVEMTTVRGNSKRSGDSRYEWVMTQFKKGLRDEEGASHKTIKLYVLGGEKSNHGIRAGKMNHFVKASVVFKDQFGSIWVDIEGRMIRKIDNGDFVKRGRPVKIDKVTKAIEAAVETRVEAATA